MLRSGACRAPTASTPPTPAKAAPSAKAPSSKAPPKPTPAEPAAALPTDVRLCSWNIEKLGHGEVKDYRRIASIIEGACDLIALQEVMEKKHLAKGYDELGAALGAEWQGAITPDARPPNDSQGERYAAFYRKNKVSRCDGPDLTWVPDADDLFYREPAYGCFVAGKVDLMLVVYHARFSKGNRDAIMAEVEHLREAVAAVEKAAPAGEKDILVIGDLNLRKSDVARVLPYFDATDGTGSTLNARGEITDHLYDHLLVVHREDTREVRGEAEVLDVRGQGFDPATYARTVSDQLPIRVVIDGRVDDDGPGAHSPR